MDFTTCKPGTEKDYVCKNNGLHDYSITVGEDDKLLVERCVNCGHEIRFVKDGNRIDNTRYGESHLLWFLQPNHPLYAKYYKNKPLILPSKAQKRKEAIELAKEEIRRAAFESD